MNSRYVLDFAPSIAVALTATLICLLPRDSAQSRNGKLHVLLVGIAIAWWAIETLRGTSVFHASPIFTKAELVHVLQGNTGVPQFTDFPKSYTIGMDLPRLTKIKQNGSGWDTTTGSTKGVVVLFVSDLDVLTIDVTASSNLPESDYTQIRAKIGLEWLQLDSIEQKDTEHRLTFRIPRKQMYRKGIQILFLSFAKPTDFLTASSQFELRSVQWTIAD